MDTLALYYKPGPKIILEGGGEEQKKQTGTRDWKHVKGKRVRTIFTPEQLERLEAEFERQQYMVGTERYYLASALNLTEAQVKVWFQNRRIKWRKHNLEQQQAKMAKLGLYRHIGSDSESDTGDENQELASPSNLQIENAIDDQKTTERTTYTLR
ncbi:hypothetical protein ScPMuIL_001220 [Solemya velum]